MPGYRVERALTGGRQRAVEAATGEHVLLQPCAASAERLAAVVRALRDLPSPYVLRPRRVVDTATGPVLVLDDAPAGALSALLERRGRLTAGEVVTVGVTVGRALAALHAAGLVHGALSADDVVFAATGMPLLAGVRPCGRAQGAEAAAGGTARGREPAEPTASGRALAGPGTAGGPAAEPAAADDVLALAALCATALLGDGAAPVDTGTTPAGRRCGGAPRPDDGRADPGRVGADQVERADADHAAERAHADRGEAEAVSPLLAVVEAGLAPDPARRPGAAAFATALQRAARAAPVRGLRVAGPALLEADPPALRSALAVPVATTSSVVRARPQPAPPHAHTALGGSPVLRRLRTGRAGGTSRRPLGRRGRHAAPVADAGRPWTRSGLLVGCAAAACAAALVLLLSGSSERAPAASALTPPTSEPLVLDRPLGGADAVPPPRAGSRRSAGAAAAARGAAQSGDAPPPTDWAAELDRLDRTRAAAYAAGDRRLLRRVYAPGAAAERADLAALDQLAAAGRTVTGLRHRLVEVRPARTHAERAELRVVDVLGEHALRDSTGTRVETRPGRDRAPSVVVLRRVEGEWRLERVRPA